MLDRYSREAMRAIWSDEDRYRRWLDVELAVCEVLAGRRVRLLYTQDRKFSVRMSVAGRKADVGCDAPNDRL